LLGPVPYRLVDDAQLRAIDELSVHRDHFPLHGLQEDGKDVRLAVFRDVTDPDHRGPVTALQHAHVTVLIDGCSDYTVDNHARFSREVHFRPGAHGKVTLVALDESRRCFILAEYIALHQPRDSAQREHSRLRRSAI